MTRAAVASTTAALVGLLATMLWPTSAQACAGCRNPNLPITRLSTVHLAPWEVRASAILSATSLNVVHEAGCVDPASCQEVPVQPRFVHDQDIQPAELRAVAELGLTRSLGLELQVPFRITRTAIRYADLSGRPYQPLDPDVHHRNETIAGPGDPWLLGRWGRSFLGTAVTVRGGVSFPIGSTEEDPFALGAEGKRHQHIQLGNGTFDPLLMLDVSRTFGRVDLSAYAQAQLSLYESSKGFQAGNRFFTGVQAGTLAIEKVTVALGLDVMSERPERWGGEIQQDGSLGRTELLGGLSLSRSFGATLATLIARVPLYRHIVTGDEPQGQLSSPLMLSLLLSRTFGGRR
jgi:hypothetical protein